MTFTFQSPLVSIPLHGLPVAAAALDRNSVIVAANDRFTRLCGRTESTGPGQRLADVVAEQDRPVVEQALDVLLREDHRAPRTCSLRARRAEAPALWLAIDVARLGPSAAVPCLACLHAIPRRRRVDRVMDRRRPAPRAKTTHAAGSLSPTVKPWPPFLMTLSHEFRGPLTAIRGWAQMAEKGFLRPEMVTRAFSVISRNAASLSGMIETMFDLSRRAAGSLVLTRQRLDLTPLVQLIVESNLPAAAEHGVILTIQRARTPLLVDGDTGRLEQVVRNLVENAIKFTPKGGHVHVHTGDSHGFAEIVVTDDGFGIPPDLLRAIFEPFTHEDATVHPSERGLGLGLALVRELVELHGGEVHALSEGRGQGSTFVVRLPLANAVAVA